jgi:hypothetical protein
VGTDVLQITLFVRNIFLFSAIIELPINELKKGHFLIGVIGQSFVKGLAQYLRVAPFLFVGDDEAHV